MYSCISDSSQSKLSKEPVKITFWISSHIRNHRVKPRYPLTHDPVEKLHQEHSGYHIDRSPVEFGGAVGDTGAADVVDGTEHVHADADVLFESAVSAKGRWFCRRIGWMLVCRTAHIMVWSKLLARHKASVGQGNEYR